MKILLTNKKAYFNYEVKEEYEAGIELKGTEVKSLQKNNASITESYVTFKKGEAYITNMHISPYEEGNIFNVNPTRPRKLLLHRKEITKLMFDVKKESLTIIPLKIYWKKNKIKVLIGLAKGKKLHDKRESIKERDLKRENKIIKF